MLADTEFPENALPIRDVPLTVSTVCPWYSVESTLIPESKFFSSFKTARMYCAG